MLLADTFIHIQLWPRQQSLCLALAWHWAKHQKLQNYWKKIKASLPWWGPCPAWAETAGGGWCSAGRPGRPGPPPHCPPCPWSPRWDPPPQGLGVGAAAAAAEGQREHTSESDFTSWLYLLEWRMQLTVTWCMNTWITIYMLRMGRMRILSN